MQCEYEGCYSEDFPAEELRRAGIILPDTDYMTMLAMINAWKLGFDAGAAHIQEEWDNAEELQAEMDAGWDY